MGKWKTHVTSLQGTDGRKIKLEDWKDKTVKCGDHQKDSVPRFMRLGQLGCYDSHVRAWQHMTERNYEMMVIAEDDADIRYSSKTIRKLKTCLREVRDFGVEFDLLYLGHGSNKVKRRLTPHLYEPWKCQTAYFYVLTLRGAKKLLAKCFPYKYPVDVYMHKVPGLKVVAFHPRVCGVSGERSDTENIK